VINGLRSYSAYKPSGVPWLGDVPEHWDVLQLGRIGVFSKGSGGTKDDEVLDGIPCIRYGDLYTTHKYFISQIRSYISPAKAGTYTPTKRGDVLFPTSGETIEEIGKSAVNLIHAQVFCGGDLIIFRPTVPMEPKFAGYALDCPAAQTQKSLMGRGITIMHIYSGQLKYLWLPLPTLPDQAAIVRFLDHADEQIQRYIASKERLIALLEEERQALIHQAVTRGLDPNVRLKPSSVEWLGDVPEHWEVMPLKRAFVSMDYGISDSGSQTGGVRLLTMGNIRDGSVTVPSTGGVTAVDQSLLLGKNDLLFNRTNSAELVAKVGLFSGHDSPVTFASYLVRMRSRSSNEPEYLNMALNETTFLAQARREAVPSLHQSNLNPTRYGRIQISLPPKEEQKTILSALAEKTNGLKTSMELAHRQIELIEEYRTRLIADVVTGKIDVREAKP
jgi:type I restriction enzyme S subunit